MNAPAPPKEIAYGTLVCAKKAIDAHALEQGYAVRIVRSWWFFGTCAEDVGSKIEYSSVNYSRKSTSCISNGTATLPGRRITYRPSLPVPSVILLCKVLNSCLICQDATKTSDQVTSHITRNGPELGP